LDCAQAVYAIDSQLGLAMANNPLALLGIVAEPPQEAEYDAVYAAVTATERGRWFLTEFARRNRHADTGALMAMLARIEAAVTTDARMNQSVVTPNLAAAAEEIADIAFGLRERGADSALCDALDAAVRHIGAASGSAPDGQEAADRAPPPEAVPAIPAGETLPSAADRIDERADSADKPAGFEFELQDREEFATAAAALAASLSALDGQSIEESRDAPAAEQQPATAAAIPPSVGVIPAHDYTTPVEAELQPVPVANAARWYIEAPDFVFQPTARSTNGHAVPSSNTSGELQPLPPRQRLANPQDDPAELFEPASAPAVKSNAAALRVADAAPVSAAPATVSKIAAAAEPAPPVLAAPRPVPVSPLAALRALSEDELLALFG
jgi:hypothetical protein